MRSISAMSWITGIVMLAGCAPLGEIEHGLCGNRVVETDNGEDCDSEGENGFKCVACRYECRTEPSPEDGIDDRCPAGFLCGIDLVCRAPSRSFETPELLVGGRAYSLGALDFNADGFEDILAVTERQTSVHYLSGGGTYSSSYDVSSFPTPLAVGDFSRDSLPDLALVGGEGISVLRGQEGRSLASTIYEGATRPDIVAVAPADVIDAIPGDELVSASVRPAPGTGNPEIVISAVSYLNQFEENRLFSVSLEQYPTPVGEVVSARLSPYDRCDSIVLAFSNRLDIQVFRTCNDSGAWNGEFSTMTNVQLPLARNPWGGVLAGDIDNDDDLDLLVGSTGVSGERLEILVHTEQGFEPLLPPVSIVDDQDAVCEGVGADRDRLIGLPLAVGDLNGDGAVDLIDRRGILYMTDAGPRRAPCFYLTAGWAGAVIGHFNLDPYPDFATFSDGGNLVEVFLGRGDGAFSPFYYEVPLGIERILTGDLDGDSANDLIVWQDGTDVVDEGDLVAVLFGRAGGPPEQPALLGFMGDVQQIAVGTNVGLDGFDDLTVISGTGMDASLSYLPGDLGRRIQSPIILTRPPDGPMQAPKVSSPGRLAAGDFDGDTFADLIVLAQEAEFSATGPTEGMEPLPDSPTEAVYWLLRDLNKPGVQKEALKVIPNFGATYERGIGIVAVNLDARLSSQGDPDELVLFSSPDGATDTITWWRAGEDGMIAGEDRAIDLESRLLLAPRLIVGTEALSPSIEVYPPLEVADVDDDGLRDIILTTEKGEVVVLWNHGDFGGEEVTVLAVPEVDVSDDTGGFPIRDVAFINLDKDSELELVTLTAGGIRAFDLERPAGVARQDWRFSDLGVIDPDGGGSSLAVLDADRNGLPDLIVGRESGIHILRAK